MLYDLFSLKCFPNTKLISMSYKSYTHKYKSADHPDVRICWTEWHQYIVQQIYSKKIVFKIDLIWLGSKELDMGLGQGKLLARLFM